MSRSIVRKRVRFSGTTQTAFVAKNQAWVSRFMPMCHRRDLIKGRTFNGGGWIAAGQEAVGCAVSSRTDALGVLEPSQDGNSSVQWIEGRHRLAKLELPIDGCRVPTPVTLQGETMPDIQGKQPFGHVLVTIFSRAFQ